MPGEDDNEGFNNGDGQEFTTNEIATYLAKRTRKYLRKCHGQCCTDDCGCCPRIGPEPPPSVHSCRNYVRLVTE